MLYKISNGRWSSIGDAAIYHVQTKGLASRGHQVTVSTTCDCVILGGGGTLYQPASHIDRNFMGIPCNMHFKDIAECLYSQDIPFYVLGAGCQQFSEDHITRESWRDLLCMTTGISVRDTWSKTQLVETLQLPVDLSEKIQVYPDPAFELFSDGAICVPKTDNIMISGRSHVIEKIIPAIDILRHQYRIVWCPMDTGDYSSYRSWVQPTDILQASEFHGRYFPDYELYMNTLRNCCLNISDRLHAFIFSVLMGRGIIVLQDRQYQKVHAQISDLFGLQGYQYVTLPENEAILQHVEMIRKHSSSLTRTLVRIARQAAMKAKQHYKILTGV